MTATASRRCAALCLALAATLLGGAAQAGESSDNALNWRVGNAYREPFNPNEIRKNIFALSHASSDKDDGNFFNLDLKADETDPRSLSDNDAAQEASLVFRHTLDIGKIRGREIKFGAVRGVGLTLGADWSTRNDVGYYSRKRMLMLGPTLMWDVPGFLNTSVLLLRESTTPGGVFAPLSNLLGRDSYDLHPMLSANWGIPVSRLWSFEGYANVIGAKGVDEAGNEIGAETNIDMQMMFDAGAAMGRKKNIFRIGVEYQYGNNKFGPAGQGFRPRTPMFRAEYHF
jgi:hypothetical protein